MKDDEGWWIMDTSQTLGLAPGGGVEILCGRRPALLPLKPQGILQTEEPDVLLLAEAA